LNDPIRIRGASQNNLKGFDLDLPTGRLIVVTGLSGSGKSSLAFDTLYAEGQRRYIETFSPYARQFFDRMDKPRVDAIEGIPPAIALEQRNSVRTTRSTVGTMTEICDHMKVLWPHLARLHCRACGKPVIKESPRDIWDRLPSIPSSTADPDFLVTFEVPLSPKIPLQEQLTLVMRQGFQRLWFDGSVVRLDEIAPVLERRLPPSLHIVQDRTRRQPSQRPRFVEACEQAYHFGHGKLTLFFPSAPSPDGQPRWNEPHPFSRHLHCATCDIAYAEPTPALFSFNHPLGACPACKGFGRVIGIDYNLAIPDPGKTLNEGAVKPWQTGTGAESQADLVRSANKARVPLDVPFRDLSPEHQRWVIDGDPNYGKDNEWPTAWYGLKGYFRYLESKAYKMHVRVLLSRYRAYTTCPTCLGKRLQPDALLWRIPLPVSPSQSSPELSLADFYALPIRTALQTVDTLAQATNSPQSASSSTPRNRRTKDTNLPAEPSPAGNPPTARSNDPFHIALQEVRSRLLFLDTVGVGYLTLDRPTRTLSGGETQRVNLTTCLGSRLVNTLFVLDEPSVGLHPRDTDRLVQILLRLRDLGNTVVVVEHEAAVMRAADQILDLGPGHGDSGGHLVFQGTLKTLLKHPHSLTAAYLSGRTEIPVPPRRSVPQRPASLHERSTLLSDLAAPYRTASRAPDANRPGTPHEPFPFLTLREITRNNLQRLTVTLPLGRLLCLTGVSGSGKTTLVSELLRLLRGRLSSSTSTSHLGAKESEREPVSAGDDSTDNQDDATDAGGSMGRLDGAEHLGAFLLVDQSPISRTPRSNPAVYTGSFEHIRDIFASSEPARQRGLNASAFSFNSAQGQCEQCRGAGFEKIEMQFLSDVFIRCPACDGRRYRPHILEIRISPPDTQTSVLHPLSIADVLDLTIDEAIEFFSRFPGNPARLARESLVLLRDVGLGYLRLGQPINTLSGGESQRLKLAGHLATTAASSPVSDKASRLTSPKPTLFIFDEPTTGLHFEDVRVLLRVFQQLVDAGHSVLIVEHNVDVVKSADWVIDLGPEAGPDGGRIVIAGTPESVADCPESHTGAALRQVIGR